MIGSRIEKFDLFNFLFRDEVSLLDASESEQIPAVVESAPSPVWLPPPFRLSSCFSRIGTQRKSMVLEREKRPWRHLMGINFAMTSSVERHLLALAHFNHQNS